MATIGVAEEYEAVIVDSDTQEPLLYLPWSNLNWSRKRNDLSNATVTIAGEDGGIESCGPIGGLVGWQQMLRIERNGGIVWDGPITGWREEGGILVIRALDRFAITKKRLTGNYIFRDITPTNSPNTLINDLLASADIADASFNDYALTIVSNGAEAESISREYRVENLDYIYDSITEICGSTTTGYFCCIRDQVYINEAEVRAFLPYSNGSAPSLNEISIADRPTVDVDCMNQATKAYVGISGTGLSGFPEIFTNDDYQDVYVDAFLEIAVVEQRTGNTNEGSLSAGRLAASAATPDFTLERLRLSPHFGAPGFPADLSYLVPGIRCSVDFESTCAFNVPMVEYHEAQASPFFPSAYPVYTSTATIQVMRLDEIEVAVARGQGGGPTESIMASFRPTTAGVP